MKSLKIYISSILIVSLCSCSNFLELDPPIDQLVKSTVFTDELSAEAALMGIYGEGMSTNVIAASLTMVTALNADEMITALTADNYLQLQQSSVRSDNGSVQNLWLAFYRNIYRVNALIEGLESSNTISVTIKNRLIGEAIFIRAWCNFYLVNLWGDVPLITSTDYEVNQLQGRTPISNMYQHILDDLDEANNLLELDYPSDERVRINKLTVQAFQARVRLYLGNWQDAINLASNVIESGMYDLSTEDAVFKKDSRETIWQLMEVDPVYTTSLGQQLVPASATAIPNWMLSETLHSSFEEGDLRRENWMNSNVNDNDVYVYPFKYKVRLGEPRDEYMIVFRLAEQHLIRAEAFLETGNMDRCAAEINTLRNRAGLEPVVTISPEVLRSALIAEKQREFFIEWGHRWFDLKRWGILDEYMSKEKPDTWESNAEYFPIPLNEILSNPNLEQNAGY